MRALLLCILALCNGAWALAPAPTDAQAQEAHAQGSCGSMGPGTGLSMDGTGWVVSMLPGTHEFRVIGEGTVVVTAARLSRVSFDAGRPYYIQVTGTGRLEWKVPGSDWGSVSRLFLYPKTITVLKPIPRP